MKFRILIIVSVLLGVNFNLIHGTIQPSPTRVVFEANTKIQTITLVNKSTRAETYRLKWDECVMRDDGTVISVTGNTKSVCLPASPMVMFSPRQITVLPGESFVVRLMVRRPADLMTGEYRSHLVFCENPDSSANDIEQITSQNIKIVIKQLYNVSIPVFIRQGELTCSVKITDLHLQQQQADWLLDFNLQRTGNRSQYGRIKVIYENKDSTVILAELKGIGIYTDISVVKKQIKLTIPEGVSFNKGQIRVEFIEINPNLDPDKGPVLSTAVLPISA